MTQASFKTVLLDPDIMFSQDIIADPTLAPQLTDPDRIAAIKAYAKGTFPDRPPDISTPRTDVYILGWEDKDPTTRSTGIDTARRREAFRTDPKAPSDTLDQAGTGRGDCCRCY